MFYSGGRLIKDQHFNCVQLGESLIYGALTAVSHTGGARHPRGSAKSHAALEKRAGTCLFSKHDFLGWWSIWKMLSAMAAASLWRWIELRAESVRRGWSRERGRSGLYGFLACPQAYPRHAATFSASWRYASACGLGRDQIKGRGVGREGYQKAGEGRAIGKQREPSVASAALIRHDLCATVPNRTIEQHGECKILPLCNVRATSMRQLERVTRGS